MSEIYPLAPRPALYMADEKARALPSIELNMPRITERLLESGLREKEANSFAVVLHEREPGDKRKHTRGWYNGNGLIRHKDGEWQEHPVVVNLVWNASEDKMSKTTWHEFGHVEHDLVYGIAPQTRAAEQEKEMKVQSAGIYVTAAGIIFEIGDYAASFVEPVSTYMYSASAGAVPLMLGLTCAYLPEQVYYAFSSRERHARKYARQHRKDKIVRFKK